MIGLTEKEIDFELRCLELELDWDICNEDMALCHKLNQTIQELKRGLKEIIIKNNQSIEQQLKKLSYYGHLKNK